MSENHEKMEINQIRLGDAYELIKQIPNKSIDLIVTDPPYEYDSLSGSGIAGQKRYFEELKASGIDKGFDLSILDEFVRVLKKINIYIWVSKKQFKKVLDYMVEKYGCCWDLIVWNKTNPTPLCRNQYLHDCEYCLYFRKGAKLNVSYDTAKTVYFMPRNQADKQDYGHPTIKPLEIIANIVKNSCGGGNCIRSIRRERNNLFGGEKAWLRLAWLRDKPRIPKDSLRPPKRLEQARLHEHPRHQRRG